MEERLEERFLLTSSSSSDDEEEEEDEEDDDPELDDELELEPDDEEEEEDEEDEEEDEESSFLLFDNGFLSFLSLSFFSERALALAVRGFDTTERETRVEDEVENADSAFLTISSFLINSTFAEDGTIVDPTTEFVFGAETDSDFVTFSSFFTYIVDDPVPVLETDVDVDKVTREVVDVVTASDISVFTSAFSTFVIEAETPTIPFPGLDDIGQKPRKQ